MLTADLVQVRFYRSEIRPRYVDVTEPGALALADQLIDAFKAHVGQRRGELEAVLEELRGKDPDFLLHRGLAKLLWDRSQVESPAQIPPEELRQQVFSAAAAAYRAPTTGPFVLDRAAILREVAEPLLFVPAVVEQWLYADLKDEQRLIEFEDCTPEYLLHRYNVGLAQGILLRARELTLEWSATDPRHTRELLRKIKFFRLLHRIERRRDGHWLITLDGPASIFQSTGKYGVAMASFLPTLLHFEGWKLEATVRWKDRRADSTFRLTPEQQLRPLSRLTGQWQPEELQWLPEQLVALDADWQVDPDPELVELSGGGVLVPDFVFVHRPTGCRVPLEIFGYWRRHSLKTRLEQLRSRGPANLLIALSKDLAADHEELEELAAELYVYRTHPNARQVLPRLQEILARHLARNTPADTPRPRRKSRAAASKTAN